MLLSKHEKIKISGVSVAIPSSKISVNSFREKFGDDVIDKFVETTGVKEITRAIEKQTASDLGYNAFLHLVSRKKIEIEDIGVLIFVSQKPDYRFPSTSAHLKKRIGLKNDVFCIDINLACSGFVYGLQTAFSSLSASKSKYAVLITADTSHKTLSDDDRTMIMLFGDSGSALLLEKEETYSFSTQFAVRTNGKKFKSIITPSGAFRNRDISLKNEPWSDGIIRSDYNTHMKGMDVFSFSISDVPKLINDFFSITETNASSYDFFTLHQANLYILKQISRKCKIPMDKIPVSLDRFGNNSSNSVPLVICDHFSGDNKTLNLFIAGFGAGLSWGCGNIEIDTEFVYPIFISDNYYKQHE